MRQKDVVYCFACGCAADVLPATAAGPQRCHCLSTAFTTDPEKVKGIGKGTLCPK